MNRSYIKKYSNLILIVFFISLIFSSPIIMLVTKQEKWSEAEQRGLAILPLLPKNITQFVVFFGSVSDYLDDHFGFREFYIRRYRRELAKRFDQVSSHATVAKGLDGWYFFNNFGILDDFFGYAPLGGNTIKKWWALQEAKYSWLQDNNIQYLSIIAPNKQSIYPEYLMKNFISIKGKTRFEELLNFTDNQLPDYMINLHQVLRPERYKKPLYFKNDSHWNQFGAFLVFQNMFEKISTWFPDENFDTDFKFTEDETGKGGNTGHGGDLVKMLMLPNLTETYPQLATFKRCGAFVGFPYELTNVVQSPGRESFVRSCPTKKLRAIVFRDSFFVPLELFFSENFKEIIYLWKGYDRKNIEEIITIFKPDIVIEEIVERHVFDSLLAEETP